jgi:hypothetical protein
MEIIVHGGDEKYIHRFTCNKCGCVFDQDEDEFMLYFYPHTIYNTTQIRCGIFTFCPKDCGGYGIMETSPSVVKNRLLEYKERFYYRHEFCHRMISISQVKKSQTYMCGFISAGAGYTIKCPIHGDMPFYNVYYKAGKRFMD